MSKVYIIIGHFGSGKSEFSVNFAKRLKGLGQSVCLADLDIVNPYFRSRERREELTALGIEVLSDILDSIKGLDIPYLSPAIRGHIANSKQTMILDCGGDQSGLTILKQFEEELAKRTYEVLMIINTFRPQTSSVAQILEMKAKLEATSGLEVSGYINNSNYLRATTLQEYLSAQDLIEQVSLITEVPIKYLSGIENLMKQLPQNLPGEKITLNLSLREDWL